MDSIWKTQIKDWRRGLRGKLLHLIKNSNTKGKGAAEKGFNVTGLAFMPSSPRKLKKKNKKTYETVSYAELQTVQDLDP